MPKSARRAVAIAIWVALTIVISGPVLIAANSPYLAYRDTAYIIGGFAGIIGLSLLLIQLLLAAGYLPGAELTTKRQWRRWVGSAIVACLFLHVGGLYITSPPDTLDALPLVSPGLFRLRSAGDAGDRADCGPRHSASPFGIALCDVASCPNSLSAIVVAATVTHALQIEGAMGIVSKWGLCLAVIAATGVTLIDLRQIRPSFARKDDWIRPGPETRKQKAGE